MSDAIDRMAETAIVYRGGKRRFFTAKAALRAEAKMIIRLHLSAAGDDPAEIDAGTFSEWVTHLAEKIGRGNRQFDLANPLDRN